MERRTAHKKILLLNWICPRLKEFRRSRPGKAALWTHTWPGGRAREFEYISLYSGTILSFLSLQHSPRLLSPGSGAISARYGWTGGGVGVGGVSAPAGGSGGVSGGSMASTPEDEDAHGRGSGSRTTEEDEDSGTGSTSEAHVIRHIDRNILACQICQHRYRLPKVGTYAYHMTPPR